MSGKLVTEQQVAELVGKTLNNLDIIVPKNVGLKTTSVLAVNPSSEIGVELVSVNSQSETIKATAYRIHNITLTYNIKNNFWSYINGLGIDLASIVDIYDCFFEITHNGSIIVVKGNKKGEIPYALATESDLAIVADTFTSSSSMESNGPTNAIMYIQFLTAN